MTTPDPSPTIQAGVERADTLRQHGRTEEALAVLNDVMPRADRDTDPADCARWRMHRALCLQDLFRHKEALADYDEAMVHFQQHGPPADLRRCRVCRAICWRQLGYERDPLGYENPFAGDGERLRFDRGAWGEPRSLESCMVAWVILQFRRERFAAALASIEDTLHLFGACL